MLFRFKSGKVSFVQKFSHLKMLQHCVRLPFANNKNFGGEGEMLRSLEGGNRQKSIDSMVWVGGECELDSKVC
jgi:hypothetical protein